jgi:hypothetical protein
MADPTTPHVRMPAGLLRRIGVLGLANTDRYWLRPASLTGLIPIRPHTHAAAESTI